MAFVKLFDSILASTIWDQDHATVRVWVTMLLKSDRDGNVFTSVPGLARIANVTREECDKAIEYFMAPDTDSASPDHDGRRVETIDRGFRLLNFEKYHSLLSIEDKREKDRQRQERKRERDKQACVTNEGT